MAIRSNPVCREPSWRKIGLGSSPEFFSDLKSPVKLFGFSLHAISGSHRICECEARKDSVRVRLQLSLYISIIDLRIHQVSDSEGWGMRRPRTESIFVHIPKTGGSSISERFTRTFGPSLAVADLVREPMKHGTAAKCIHYTHEVENLQRPSFFVAVYRSPHERMLSHYLWRLEHSSHFKKFNKKMSLVGLWKSIESSKSMYDFLSVDSEDNIPLVVLDFESLDQHLEILIRIMTGSTSAVGEQLNVNRNPLKESTSQSLRVWAIIAKLMVQVTRHRHDYKLEPRGSILVTELPHPT